ncbi:membrane-associated lipoprotein precurser [Mesoplasma florum W37]|uniref:lipoprotein n=1 Tax=Mesoplasma florum TaxID=2151 RepID=UPI0003B9368D|nr:lipoprotein [Mesoplasma florum]AGY41543.1 membrane-associated lipoprotein precurser [Mesoplasma florum W37]
MKKLLSILGAVGLTATGASVAVSCSNTTDPGDKEVATTGVQALLDAAVKDKEFESDAKAIDALKAVKLTTGLVLDGEPTVKADTAKEATEKTFIVKVKADKGYKLADKSVTSFEVKAIIKESETVTPGEKTELNSTLIQTSAVEVADLSSTTLEADILTALSAANASANLKTAELKVTIAGEEGSKTYTLEPKDENSSYSGSLLLTVTETVEQQGNE